MLFFDASSVQHAAPCTLKHDRHTRLSQLLHCTFPLNPLFISVSVPKCLLHRLRGFSCCLSHCWHELACFPFRSTSKQQTHNSTLSPSPSPSLVFSFNQGQQALPPRSPPHSLHHSYFIHFAPSHAFVFPLISMAKRPKYRRSAQHGLRRGFESSSWTAADPRNTYESLNGGLDKSESFCLNCVVRFQALC